MKALDIPKKRAVKVATATVEMMIVTGTLRLVPTMQMVIKRREMILMIVIQHRA